MQPVFLSFQNAGGETRYASLETANAPIFYLPFEVDDEIELSTTVPPGRKDYTQLEPYSHFVLLSQWGQGICDIFCEGAQIRIPQSTETSQKSLLLRDGDQFVNEAGRWSIQRDDEHGTIQSSMRPPPLPVPPQVDLQEIKKEEDSPAEDMDLDPSPEAKPVSVSVSVLVPGPVPGSIPMPETESAQDSGCAEDVPFASLMEIQEDAGEGIEASSEKQATIISEAEHSEPSKKRKRARSSESRSTPLKETTPESAPMLGANSRRSTRSATASPSPDEPEEEDTDSLPVVFFANSTTVDQKKLVMKTFKKLGGQRAESISEANILCVGEGPLKKTANLLLAIVHGLDIVTDRWMTEVYKKKHFPSRANFRPTDARKEGEWGFKLNDAIQRGKEGRDLTHLLDGVRVYMTTQLTNELGPSRTTDIISIALALGANEAKKELPKVTKKSSSVTTIVLGTVNDAEAGEVARLGLNMFDKEVLTSAVLKGRVDLDGDDFLIKLPIKEEYSSQ